MARKNANYFIEEKIEPMNPDAMNPPENLTELQIVEEKNHQFCLCQIPSDSTIK